MKKILKWIGGIIIPLLLIVLVTNYQNISSYINYYFDKDASLIKQCVKSQTSSILKEYHEYSCAINVATTKYKSDPKGAVKLCMKYSTLPGEYARTPCEDAIKRRLSEGFTEKDINNIFFGSSDDTKATDTTSTTMKTYSNKLFSVDYPDTYTVKEENVSESSLAVTISGSKGKITINNFGFDIGENTGDTSADTLPKDIVYHGDAAKISSAMYYKAGDTETVKALKTIQNSIKVTNSTADDTDSSSDDSDSTSAKYLKVTTPDKSTYSLNGSHIEIKGTNTIDVTEVWVVFENKEKSLNDNYKLVKFKEGDTTWAYTADTKYGNLGAGKNVYKIQAYTKKDSGKTLLETKEITVNATISNTTVAAAKGGTIEVSFLNSPQKLDTTAFMKNYTPAYKYEYTKQYYNDSMKDFEIYKLGKVTKGTYKDTDLLMIFTACTGMCVEIPSYRVIKKQDNSLIVLDKMSVGYIQEEDKDIFNFLSDKETTISNLLPPATVSIPNSKDKLIRENKLYFTFFDKLKKTKAFSSNEAGQDFFIDSDVNCLVARNKDNTYSVYYINFNFFADSTTDKNHTDIRLGKLQVNWNDKTNTTDYYSFSKIGGCGRKNCYDIADIKEDGLKNLVVKGKLADGTDVYEEQYTNAEIDNIITTLNSETNDSKRYLSGVYSAFFTENKPDFKSFFQSHPVIYIKDSFNRFIRFTKQVYMPAVECGKPVIYLYPEVTTDVSVKVKPNGGFSKTEPTYSDGWHVKADPLSNIYNYDDDTTYPYLFWEGHGYDYRISEKGFVVANRNLERSLQNKLALLGLNTKETADFMEFWVPEMRKQNKPYYFITFMDQAKFENLAPLTVSPRPDTVIRVFMDYKGLDRPMIVEPLEIKTPKRRGFTVVEWGGALHR